MKKKRFNFVYFLVPTFFFIISFYLFPTIYNFRISISDLNLLRMMQKPTFVGLSNYLDFIKRKSFFQVLFNTAFWLTFVTISVRLILGLLIALLLNSKNLKRIRITGVVRTLVLIPWATPPIVAIYVWKWLLQQQYGLVNKILVGSGVINNPIAFFGNVNIVWFSVILIFTWNTLPFVVIVILAGLQSIPDELYEAAYVDGAGKIYTFTRITIPLLLPTISVTTLLIFIWSFNNFEYVWLTTKGGPGTFTNVLSTAIYLKAFTEYKMGYSSAIGMIMTFIVFIFAFISLKYVIVRRLEVE